MMKTNHKILSIIIFSLVLLSSFLFKAKLTNETAQSLVTFFSVVFGFYITSIAILYNSTYAKNLHALIDKKAQKRSSQILKSYLLISGYMSIFSISIIIIFIMLTTQSSSFVLSTNIAPLIVPFFEIKVDLNILPSSVIIGFSGVNIFYMLLIFNTIIDAMIEETKK